MKPLYILLWTEAVIGLLGCGVWFYQRSFWNGGSALLGLVLALAQLPLGLCAYITYARSSDRGERHGKLFAAVSILAVWNFAQWYLFFAAHQ